jgi:hypothetical protein
MYLGATVDKARHGCCHEVLSTVNTQYIVDANRINRSMEASESRSQPSSWTFVESRSAKEYDYTGQRSDGE